jgi:hypothetical protein
MNSHNTSVWYRLTFALLSTAAGMFFLVKGFSAGRTGRCGAAAHSSDQTPTTPES